VGFADLIRDVACMVSISCGFVGPGFVLGSFLPQVDDPHWLLQSERLLGSI